IQTLSERIWWAHYPGIISNDQIRYMLERMYAVQTLTEILASGHRFMLAELNGAPAAYCQSEPRADHHFIHKIYADPALHGQGLGKSLMDDARHAAAGKPLRLHVNRHNTKALNFYHRYGFTIIAD